MNDILKKQGAFSWAELMTSDLPAAKTFYGELFGWQMQEMPMEDVDYTLVGPTAEQPMGGMMKLPADAEGCPPHWGVYVTVDDVDATAEKAVELGGKVILPPRDIPEVGRFCVIQDPQGATLAAISYNTGNS